MILSLNIFVVVDLAASANTYPSATQRLIEDQPRANDDGPLGVTACPLSPRYNARFGSKLNAGRVATARKSKNALPRE